MTHTRYPGIAHRRFRRRARLCPAMADAPQCRAAPHNPCTAFPVSCASPTPFLHTRPSHRTACTPHSGERHHPALPLVVVSSDQALIHRHECPVGLRASRTPPTAKQHPEPSPGTPDWQTPATPLSCAAARQRFRLRSPAQPSLDHPIEILRPQLTRAESNGQRTGQRLDSC